MDETKDDDNADKAKALPQKVKEPMATTSVSAANDDAASSVNPSLVIVIKDSQESPHTDSPVEETSTLVLDSAMLTKPQTLTESPKDTMPLIEEKQQTPIVINEKTEVKTDVKKVKQDQESGEALKVKPTDSSAVEKVIDEDLEIIAADPEVQDSAKIWEAEDTLKCAFCKEVFVEQGSYLIHLSTHHDMTCKEHLPLHKTKLCFFSSRYQCYNCKVKTKHRVVFREHVRHHVLKTPYKCGMCSADMVSIDAFKAHLKSPTCGAVAKNLVLKPTDIVRQVMKMLGPKAPATEHFYAVGKKRTPEKIGSTEKPASTASSDSEHAKSVSSRSSTPATSAAQIVTTASETSVGLPGKATVQSTSFIKVTRPILTMRPEKQAPKPITSTPASTTTLTSTTATATMPSVKDPNSAPSPIPTVVTDMSEKSAETANNSTPNIEETVPGDIAKGIAVDDPGKVAVTRQEDTNPPIVPACMPIDEAPSTDPPVTYPQPPAPSVAATPAEPPSDDWTPVVIGCSSLSQAQGDQDPGPCTTEIIGGQSLDIGKTQDSDIRVIETSETQPASTESTPAPVGRSADHPIVINDDDLHSASMGSHNKIKIEKKPNGIVLRLFRDIDGKMEDLSQLGLEIRDKSLFCFRCEKSFTNMAQFIPHVSQELHKIFFFHAGLCPVCKLKPEAQDDQAPCKLARILCRVLAVRTHDKHKSQVTDALPNETIHSQQIAPKQPSPQKVITIAPLPPDQVPSSQHRTILPLGASPITAALPASAAIPATPATSQAHASPFLLVNTSPQSAIGPTAIAPHTILMPATNHQMIFTPAQPQQILTPIMLAPTTLGNVVPQNPIRIMQPPEPKRLKKPAAKTTEPVVARLILPKTHPGMSSVESSISTAQNPKDIHDAKSKIASDASTSIRSVIEGQIVQNVQAQTFDVFNAIDPVRNIQPVPNLNLQNVQVAQTGQASVSTNLVNQHQTQPDTNTSDSTSVPDGPSLQPAPMDEAPSGEAPSSEAPLGEATLGEVPLHGNTEGNQVSEEGSLVREEMPMEEDDDDNNYDEPLQIVEDNEAPEISKAVNGSNGQIQPERVNQVNGAPEPTRNVTAFSIRPIPPIERKDKHRIGGKRMFAGKFMYKDDTFHCLSCNLKTKNQNMFKMHLSKHVHFKAKGASHNCTHCPDYIKFNRIGQCPVLKKTIKMLLQVSSVHPAWKINFEDRPSVLEVTAPQLMSNGVTNGVQEDDDDDDDDEDEDMSSVGQTSSITSSEASLSPRPSVLRAILPKPAPEASNSEGFTAIMLKPAPEASTSRGVRPDSTGDQDEFPEQADSVDTEDSAGDSCRRIVPFETRKQPEAQTVHRRPVQNADTVKAAHGPSFVHKCAFEKCAFRTTEEEVFKLHNLVVHNAETQFPCGYCSKKLDSVDLMLRHQDEHKGWVYKCSVPDCIYGARKIADYQLHLRETHSNESRFKCCFCTKIASEIEDILSHTELHVRTQIKCPYCDEVSSDKKVIQMHISNLHKDKPRKIVVSTQIIQDLADLEELEKQEKEAAEEAQINQVPEPDQVMAPPDDDAPETPSEITEATSQDSEEETPDEEVYEGYKPKKCEKCSFVCTTEELEEEHIALHNASQDKEKRFYCRQCPYSAETLEEYRIHVQHHEGTQTLRIYICANCDFSSMTGSKVEDHLSDKHPDEPFKFEVSQEKLEHLQLMKACDVCGEMILATTENPMKEHVDLYHSKPTKPARSSVLIKRFHCSMCTYSAPSGEDLSMHLRITHRVDGTVKPTISDPEKIISKVVASRKKQCLYECDLCSFKTANKKMFIDHHKQHAEGSTIGTYKCEFCPYESSKYKNLNHHQRIHSRQVDEGYKCAYCYYVNALKSRVSWHMSAYHPGKEKKIIEITKNNPVPALVKDASPVKPTVVRAVATKSSTTSKVYKPASLLNSEYQAPHATTSALKVSPTPAPSSQQPKPTRPMSALPQYLEDDSLRDFERNLPKDMIFKHPVFCPLCAYSNRVRVNMLRHLKTHIKPKNMQSLVSADDPTQLGQSQTPNKTPTPPSPTAVSKLPKEFLTFFSRSTELTVFQCVECPYVHVNGADMLRHAFCEHAVLRCERCDDKAISLDRMREHVSSQHGDDLLQVLLSRGDDKHKLEAVDLLRLDTMDRMTMLDEQDDLSQEDDDDSQTQETPTFGDVRDRDLETDAVLKYSTKFMVGNATRLQCKLCEYKSPLQMMKRHILTVHMKFFPFTCKYCMIGCREKWNLTVHIQKQHPGEPMVVVNNRFDPEKHGKIVNAKGYGRWKRGQRRDMDYDDSESEHSQERVTPTRDSASSFESSPMLMPAVKQEPGLEPPLPPPTTTTPPRHPRAVREHREHPTTPTTSTETTADKANPGTPKKRFCCGYCDYVSLYLKQDIQRHILLKHLLIHIYMCKKCKYATNNKKYIEKHRRENKNHGFRDFYEIKESVVEIHKDGLETIYGFPEGQLTEIQQRLEKIPGLFQHVSPAKQRSQASMMSQSSPAFSSTLDQSTSGSQLSLPQSTSEQPQQSSQYDREDEDEEEAEGYDIQDFNDVTNFNVNAVALAQVKSVKKAGEIKLPRMELFCCAYCEYKSKYGRGDVKKHIIFKHFMNKKYTCDHCGYGTFTEQIIKAHSSSAHPDLPPKIYNNEFEHECIAPLKTTSDRHMIIGIRVPPKSPIQMQRNVIFQCKLCSVEGPNIIKIKLHVVVKHWNMKPFQCPLCEAQKWKRQGMLDHIKKDHPGSTEQPVATTTKKSAELNNLVKKKVLFQSVRSGDGSVPVPSVPMPSAPEPSPTSDGSKEHKCHLCQFISDSKDELEVHMKSHSIFSCIYCPFQSMRKNEVQAHMIKDHPEFPVRIKTSMPTTTPNKQQPEQSRKRASSVVTSIMQPPAKKFNYGEKLLLASKKKRLNRSYQCKECGHQVENYKNIIEHICKHLNYFRFSCGYCSMRTLRAYTMTSHIERKHPGMAASYKLHRDEAMEQQLREGYTIVHHAPGQNREIPVECPLCGKSCGRQSTLREHLMRELNYRPFHCPFCEYTDCSGGRVNFHMRLHKDQTGRYEVKIDRNLAGQVQNLLDEAKRNAEMGITKPTPLIVKLPKPPQKTTTSDPSGSQTDSGPPSVMSISSTSVMGTSREPSINSISSATTTDDTPQPAPPTAATPSGPATSSMPLLKQVLERTGAHKCHLCNYSTNNEKLYKCHLMRTHGKRRWKCHYCPCKTVYRSTLIKHVKDTHRHLPMKIIQLLPTSHVPYKSDPDVCIVKAPTAYGVAEPQLADLLPDAPSVVKQERRGPLSPAHAAPAPSSLPEILGPDHEGLYRCGADGCSYNTTTRKHIRMHLNSHKDPDIECLYCQRMYTVIYRLRRHSKVRHPGLPIRWRDLVHDTVREEPYYGTTGLTMSQSAIRDQHHTRFCCHLCAYSGGTVKELYAHIKESHDVMSAGRDVSAEVRVQLSDVLAQSVDELQSYVALFGVNKAHVSDTRLVEVSEMSVE